MTRGHDVQTVFRGHHWQAICTCLSSPSPKYLHNWEAEDWGRRHLALVEQAKAHLSNRSPSLKSQIAYYLQRAEDPEETPENRDLWTRLAVELSKRLPDTSLGEQLALPFEVKYTPQRKRNS